MTLESIIEIANDVYGDRLVELYFKNGDGRYGDTLAKFIAAELEDTYEHQASDYAQYTMAMKVMENAANQLHDIASSFRDAIEEL